MGTHPTDRERGTEAEELAQLLPAPPVQEPSEERLRELRRCVMGEIRAQRPRRRRRLVVTVAGLGAAAVVLFAGATIASESGSHRQDANDLRPNINADLGHSGSPSPYPTNASGQTYGPNHPGAGLPELMAAHASRGENGYMYWEDLMGPVSGPARRSGSWRLRTSTAAKSPSTSPTVSPRSASASPAEEVLRASRAPMVLSQRRRSPTSWQSSRLSGSSTR